jgi:hypothetical protein
MRCRRRLVLVPWPTMSQEETLTVVGSALAQLTSRRLSALGLEALRRCRAEGEDVRHVQVNDRLGINLAEVLGETLQVEVEPRTWKEAFLEQGRLRPFREFLWWLVRTDIATPAGVGARPFRIVSLELTDRGVALLEAGAEHPLAPGFLQRLGERCPGLPADVLTQFEDARRCLEHGLLRPAATLLGLAYEIVTERLASMLCDRGLDIDPAVGAARRIVALREAIDNRLDLEREPRFAALAAIDFADQLRRRRNDGAHAHPVHPFDDHDELEEFVVSAARHLPNLWVVATAELRA